MALQINCTGLTTIDGGVVAPGAYVIFSAHFPFKGLAYDVQILIYRSQVAMTSGLAPIRISKIKKNNFTKTLTQQEYAALTPATITNDVKAFVESYIGAGNTSIVA
jgi:hypothetical protein